MNLAPITREQHGNKKIRPLASYEHARQHSILPLFGAEFARAAQEYPIGFQLEGEAFTPVALLGVEPGNNLFVGPNGQWLSTYVPAVLRRAPFMLAQLEGSEDRVVCIDLDSDRLVDETAEGSALFNEDGTPAELLTQVRDFLVELERNGKATAGACAKLAEHDLIVPWEITVTKESGPVVLSGLFRVDEAKLGTLTDEAFLELRKIGALPLVYAQLLSLSKLEVLGRLGQIHAKANAKAAAVQSKNLNLDAAFGTVDDSFHFDF